MESTICLMCGTEDAYWVWTLPDGGEVFICNVCYERIMDEQQKDQTRHLGKFQLLEEYLAEKELDNGAKGFRLTQ